MGLASTQHLPQPQSVSPWVLRFAALCPPDLPLIDWACGYGRHALWFMQMGYRVFAVDNNEDALQSLQQQANAFVSKATLVCRAHDLEGDTPVALDVKGSVIVTNYLYRAQFESLLAHVAERGVLIYETFAQGNAQFGKPSRADFLLEPLELIKRCDNELYILAYEHGFVPKPQSAMVQRLVAVRLPQGETIMNRYNEYQLL